MQLTARLKALRAVLAVADSGSTARAADLLHLSQPSVARAIAQVQVTAGLTLFERGGRGMRPTPAGTLLAARTRRALAYLARADIGPWRIGTSARGRLAEMVTSRQLDVLIALSQHASERRAADSLGVSQPAVHQALVQLEHLAGEPLFDRLASGLRLTAKGAWVVQQAKLAQAEWFGAHQELSELVGQLQGQLTVGTLPFSTGWIVPRAIERVAAVYPAVQMTLVDGTYETLVAQLRQADIDVLVGALRAKPPHGLKQMPLFDDPLAVVVRAGHPWCRKAPKRLADTHNAAWILPMPGAPARTALAEAFAAEGLQLPRGVQINSPTLIQASLLSSDRPALMSPRQVEHEIASGLLAVVPLPVRHAPRSIGFLVRDDLEPAPALRRFLEVLPALLS